MSAFFAPEGTPRPTEETPRARCFPKFERLGALGLVRFADPARRNAIGLETAAALARPVDDGSLVAAIRNEGIGAVAILSDCEGVFVSGGDLRELARATVEEANALTGAMRAFCSALSNLPVPTIALLEGPAFGGGCELALATDFRFGVGSSPALHLWQTKWALPGGWNGMARLSELSPGLSLRRASLLFAGACSLEAARLEGLGLLDERFASRAEALAAAVRFARGVLDCPVALRDGLLARSAVPEGDPAIATRARIAADDEALFAAHWMGPEHRARLAAFALRAGAQEKT